MTDGDLAPRVLRFQGRVLCSRQGEGPLGLVVTGTTEDRPDETVQVAFSCPAPADLPAELEDAKLELFGGNRHRLTGSEGASNRRAAGNEPRSEKEARSEKRLRSWSLQGPVHVHREVSAAFYQALPPRPVPLRKRLFWRVMLALASNPLARRLLLRAR